MIQAFASLFVILAFLVGSGLVPSGVMVLASGAGSAPSDESGTAPSPRRRAVTLIVSGLVLFVLAFAALQIGPA